MREDADYGLEETIDKSNAEDALDTAEKFLEQSRELINQS